MLWVTAAQHGGGGGAEEEGKTKGESSISGWFNIGNLSYGEVKLLPLVRLTQVDAESASQQILYALLWA